MSAPRHDFDWIVVGSGFGGSVAALRLAEKGYRVAVIEQGRYFADEDFARTAWDARRLVWAPRLGLRGIMRVALFRHVSVLAGVGVGGGSLVYGNTLYVPDSDAFYRHPQWGELADWRLELAPHYATSGRMLGVAEYEGDGPGERLMAGLAEDLGVAEGSRRTPVAVYFGEPGKPTADPYFEGDGPERRGCIRCGQCMLGCRHGAKNTLVKNYLWLAQRGGAIVIPERRVVDLRPLGAPDGGDGYVVRLSRPGAVARRGATSLTAAGVVVSAGTLGTNELLRRCKDSGSLPRLSDRLGELVRTNSEAIVAVTARDRDADFGGSVAISASVFPDERTHFTNNTYGAGGDALALMFDPLALLARRRLRGWSRRTVLFTVMQDTDTALRLRPSRGPFRGLQTEPDDERPLEASVPIADRVAELAARRIGGRARSSVAESLRGTPTTAHFLGGAAIGSDPASGVVDRDQRVFGYRNLLVCDGSALPANPGINPSLTIAALAERAMSKVPARSGRRFARAAAARSRA